MESDRERCFRAGMDAFFAKPTSFAKLRLALQACRDAQVFDADDALAVMGNRPDRLRRALEDFSTVVDQLMAVLEGEVADRSDEEVERAAHSLKGAAATISAERLREASAALEAAVRAGEASAMRVARERVREELGALRRTLAGFDWRAFTERARTRSTDAHTHR
jgi:HPt (histidine-containing phosphotransfer) domain-containing protein